MLGRRLPFDSLVGLRQTLYAAHPHFAALDEIAPSDVAGTVQALADLRRHARPGAVREPDPRFLPDEPDRARFGRHGGVLVHRPRPALEAAE